MRTRATDAEQGIGGAAKSVSEHLSSIFRLEVELASLELKRKLSALGVGIGLGAGAAVFLFFMVEFALGAIAAGLATTMAVWEALLIMMGATFLFAGILIVLAVASIRKGTPPVPQQAIQEAKLTSEALKSDGAAR
jgi:hypothetical protein